MRELIAIPLGLIMPWLGYGSSLSWTPYKKSFAFLTAVVTALCVLIGEAGAIGAHVTTVGFIAAQAGSVALALVLPFCTEIAATGRGEIKTYRSRHDFLPASTRPTKAAKGKWEVGTRSSNGSASVGVYIQRGGVTREIGAADPVEQMDKFMEIKAKAEQAAESFNALKIEAGG